MNQIQRANCQVEFRTFFELSRFIVSPTPKSTNYYEGSFNITSTSMDVLLKKSSAFINFNVAFATGFTIISSSTGEYRSRNLIKFNSDWVSEMPSIVTCRTRNVMTDLEKISFQ